MYECRGVRILFPDFHCFRRDTIYYTSPLCLLYLAGLNTFCIEIPTEFSLGSLRTELMPPLVPNEICLLKLSRLSSVVASARSQKSQKTS